MPQKENLLKNEKTENARAGYQIAISLRTSEGEILWSRFGVMLLVNSLFISVIQISDKTDFLDLRIIPAILPVLGLLLCILWYTMTQRGYKWMDYWILSARELEENYLNPVKSLSRGDRFKKGEEVEFDIKQGNENKTTHIQPSKLIKVELAAYITIITVGVIYLIMFSNLTIPYIQKFWYSVFNCK